jgi:hypothetical protein
MKLLAYLLAPFAGLLMYRVWYTWPQQKHEDDSDPTPFCTYCGGRQADCKCGPLADSE